MFCNNKYEFGILLISFIQTKILYNHPWVQVLNFKNPKTLFQNPEKDVLHKLCIRIDGLKNPETRNNPEYLHPIMSFNRGTSMIMLHWKILKTFNN